MHGFSSEDAFFDQFNHQVKNDDATGQRFSLFNTTRPSVEKRLIDGKTLRFAIKFVPNALTVCSNAFVGVTWVRVKTKKNFTFLDLPECTMKILEFIRRYLSPALKSERGITAIEYALLAALIAIAIIGGATLLGTTLDEFFSAIADKIKTYKPV